MAQGLDRFNPALAAEKARAAGVKTGTEVTVVAAHSKLLTTNSGEHRVNLTPGTVFDRNGRLVDRLGHSTSKPRATLQAEKNALHQTGKRNPVWDGI